MKTATQNCARAVELGIRKDSINKIVKPKLDDTTAEMQACFLKLKELVPSIPQDRKLSKTQLLQHVIDYILDLELALDFHPAMLSSIAISREPLSEKSEPNNILARNQTFALEDDDICETK